MRSFASDNNAGVHPEIMEALLAANHDHAVGYGDDAYTHAAIARFREIFGMETEVFFVYGGTGANVVGLASVLHTYHAIICAEGSHIAVDECAAPEHFIGGKLLTLPTPNGKLTPEMVKRHLHSFGVAHHAQPKAISIAQATEVGTVYTIEEIRALADLAHSHGLYLHMDGARLSNAAVALGQDFRAFTRDAGVDIVSFGGAKNGMMYGEAILLFDPSLAESTPFLRKQAMQLASKMRFISAQFTALLSNDLWRRCAENANRMARLLAEEIAQLPEIYITQEVQSNGVFAIVPPEIIPVLQRDYFFYVWNEAIHEVRWMTAFDTTEDDVRQFVASIKAALAHRAATS